MATNNYFYALGRRKRATARVRLSGGKGTFEINDTQANVYFAESKLYSTNLLKPFTVLELDPAKYNLTVKVNGGGHSGQVDAIQLGIAKALSEMNEDFKGSLRKAELLGRDPRKRERKKYGLKGARKQRQFTKR